MTQTRITTSARILATFEGNTLSEIKEIAQDFLAGGSGRSVVMDGDRHALIGFFGADESDIDRTDGSSGAVREVTV